ncbi:MAG: zf-HC2 domain-containing protein [Phycisphaerales bacterium]|nr:zf-HC2 domain-containing protein [Phycisphaerales bacterium]
MNCDQARNLFDAYMDGELAATLATEFAAHRLDCEDCRRRLALMEVVEHVVKTDEQEPEGLCDAFTDRLMACLPAAPSRRSWLKDRRRLYLGAPLAAAAAIAFLMYGPYSPDGKHLVKGKMAVGEPAPAEAEVGDVPRPEDIQDAWQQWLRALDQQLTRPGSSTATPLAIAPSLQPADGALYPAPVELQDGAAPGGSPAPPSADADLGGAADESENPRL